jgi:hypothetical protein
MKGPRAALDNHYYSYRFTQFELIDGFDQVLSVVSSHTDQRLIANRSVDSW